MTLGEQIRQRRKELGMTQEKLAEKAGIKRQHLTRLENGITQNPNLDTLKNLSVALQCNLFDYLELQTFSTGDEFLKSWNEHINAPGETITIIHKVSSESQLLTEFGKLNDIGKEKAIEQIEMLAKVPEYRKVSDIMTGVNALTKDIPAETTVTYEMITDDDKKE